jgi:hypothetical protein
VQDSTSDLGPLDLPPHTAARRYNIRVPDTPSADDHKHRRHAVYASETTGLLLIAFLLLVLTLVRYWHDIPWSLR